MTDNDIQDIIKVLGEHIKLTNTWGDRIIALEEKVKELERVTLKQV